MQFWNSRRERLREEIRTHIEMEIEENLQSGMPPEAARQAAQIKFGNTLLAVERSREVWGALWLEYLFQDLRYALRSLCRAPGYTAVVLLTLALGLGSVATILAMTDSVLLRPVPLPHPAQLVVIYGKTAQTGTYTELTYGQIQELRRDSRVFSAVSGYATTVAPVGASDGMRIALLCMVTPDFFRVLSIQPKMGRLLDSGDAAQPVVVVSYDFWHDRLHGNPHAIGSTVKLSGAMRTVIGVLPQGLEFPIGAGAPAVFAPMSLQAKGTGLFIPGAALALARLQPGVSISQALGETRSLFNHAHDGVDGQHLAVESVTRFLTGSMQTPLLALLGGVAILLLIACSNAANLQIARATERLSEMQLRSALGASFPRLLQQLLIESLVISLAGAAVGGGLSVAAVAVIRKAYAGQFARFDEIAIHPGVFAATALLAIVAGLLASLAPAFSTRSRTLAGNRRTATPRNRVSSVLVVLQITLTSVLLVTCGLFVRTFRALQQAPLGFDPHNVTTLVLMPEDSHRSPSLQRETNTLLLHRLQALPGVEAAAMQTTIPFSNYSFSMNGTTDVGGRPFHKDDSAFYSIVSSDFVRASGIHLLRGRGFLARDDGSSDMVALVNQAFVDKYLAGRNPLGVTVRMHRDPGEKDSDIPLSRNLTIVGIVEDELQGPLGSSFEPMVYLDDLQIPTDSAFLQVFSIASEYAIRSPLPRDVLDKEIRAALEQAAPGMAEMQLQSMQEGIANSLRQRRIALRLVSSFGGMALFLAAIGIYGLFAYAVTLRRREIGIRMALGSSRTGITGLILSHAGRLLFWGLIPGIAGAWLAGHAVRSFLFGVKALDPPAVIASAALLALVAALAASVPAWRAARVDPMEVLRAE